jgi:Protein of unknown function (DUF2889)
VIEPGVLAGRARWERVTDGVVDNTHDDVFTHTVTIAEPDRGLELSVVASPSPDYAIREARVRAHRGLDPAMVAAVAGLSRVRMVGGLTRAVADVVGDGAGSRLVVDAVVEAARLARQVAKFPRERAELAASGDPWECWQLDTTGWADLPDSCFTYSAAGRALFGARAVTTPMQPDLYSPRPGQTRVFVRRKVARLECVDDTLHLFHSMHDNVHGFELTYEIDRRTGRIVKARSVTSRLPYAGICSEPQRRISALVGETVDAGFRKRLSAHVGGAEGCAQLFDLTADLLKLLG